MSNVRPKTNSFILGMFVHSDLDDAELDVYEFRIWGRLCRRAGDNGRVFESAKKMAQGCRMSEKQARRALHSLQERGWLELVARYREDGSQTTNDVLLIGPPSTHRPPPLDSQTNLKLIQEKLIQEKLKTPLPPKGKREKPPCPNGCQRNSGRNGCNTARKLKNL